MARAILRAALNIFALLIATGAIYSIVRGLTSPDPWRRSIMQPVAELLGALLLVNTILYIAIGVKRRRREK
jgi:hypothetical protein